MADAPNAPRQFGGSFAPDITPEKLAAYKELATKAEPQAKEYMEALIRMVEKFRETPESTLKGTPHSSGTGKHVPLEGPEILRMWDHVPWAEELDLYAQTFDKIDPVANKPLRDAAFHLIWFGRELVLDREPITLDKIQE